MTIEKWDERVLWMRRHGVVSSKWNDAGDVTECILGPEVAVEAPPLKDSDAAKFTEEQKRKEQERIDELDYASS